MALHHYFTMDDVQKLLLDKSYVMSHHSRPEKPTIFEVIGNNPISKCIHKLHLQDYLYDFTETLPEDIGNPKLSNCMFPEENCRLSDCWGCNVVIKINKKENKLSYIHNGPCVSHSCRNPSISRHHLINKRISHKGNVYQERIIFKLSRCKLVERGGIHHVERVNGEDIVFLNSMGAISYVMDLRYKNEIRSQFLDLDELDNAITLAVVKIGKC